MDNAEVDGQLILMIKWNGADGVQINDTAGGDGGVFPTVPRFIPTSKHIIHIY